MSAFQFYKRLGQQQITPKNRTISNASTSGNIVVWTPSTSLRIAVTELQVSCNPGGTIAFFFGGANNALKLAEYSVGASATISPVITAWESTAQDAPLYVNVSTGLTNGWSVTVGGFELDQ